MLQYNRIAGKDFALFDVCQDVLGSAILHGYEHVFSTFPSCLDEGIKSHVILDADNMI